MPRKLVFLECIDIFESGHSLWDDDSTDEERERHWALVEEMHALIENPDVGLSERQKQCIIWFLENKTFTQMATIMGITYPGARGHFTRGVKKIKAYVDAHKEVS